MLCVLHTTPAWQQQRDEISSRVSMLPTLLHHKNLSNACQKLTCEI